MTCRLPYTLFLIFAALPGAWAAGEDIYADPANLQVLPKDISAEDLSAAMRSFAMGLGVRCQTCHVGEEGQPLTAFDFESDEKPMKEKARVMIGMVSEINDNYVEQLNDIEKDNRVQVRCVTCHRGQAKPELIEDVMDRTLAEGGAALAVEKYAELRDDYYGSHTFDFSEFTLPIYSQSVVKRDNLDAALALLEVNSRHFPESYYTYFMLGEVNAAAGNKRAALDSFARAIELNPRAKGFLQPKIDELESKD